MKLVPDWILDWSPDRTKRVGQVLQLKEGYHPCCGSPQTAEHRPECDHAEHLVIIGGKPAYRTKAQMRQSTLAIS